MKRAFLGVVFAGILVGGTAQPAHASFPGGNGRIVFVRLFFDESGTQSIITIRPDGSDEKTLLTTTNPDDQAFRYPQSSPDGEQIVFTWKQNGNTDLWRMNADGSGLTRLTSHAAVDMQGTWSADGSRIAFTSDRDGNEEIYSIASEGGGLLRLTNHPWRDNFPAWSPDNGRIAFASQRRTGEFGGAEIHTMRPDGSDVVRISEVTENAEWHDDPEWSPDGGRVLYARDQPDSWKSTWEIDLETMDLRQLFAGSGLVMSAVFAPASGPDRDLVAYLWADHEVEYANVYVRSTAVGSAPDQLTFTDPLLELDLSWQPIPYTFADARWSTFADEIQWLYDAGITTGCAVERFCPDDPVRREQIATFLTRALDLPPASTDFFVDDETSTHEAAINAVAQAGITTGCASDQFCPKEVVTRAQMAAFLARALDLPGATIDHFDDDDGHPREADINRLAEAGITNGCGPAAFCPNVPLTRGQAAAFLYRAFGP